ncbi:hypothetical protein [Haloprofundus salilacus]|uniref:hypothetical protein n=1 Tax=Haloprofundus salilacus TaxID=2876190 RepID=UPI001CCD2541|nr:hypothetical protein [Haloprofundus salilacus]
MEDTLRDVEADIQADLDEEGETLSEPLQDLVEALREDNAEGLRAVARYDGDDHQILYLRDDLRERFSDDEIRRRAKTLVMKGLADPRTDTELDDYGELDATLRWFENAILAIYPTGEWSGIIATFERRQSPLVDAAFDYLDDY